MKRRLLGASLLALTWLTVARAAAEAPPADPARAALAGSLRDLLMDVMPDPLVEASHWGGQRLSPSGVVWHGRGLQLRPEITKKLRNDGRWWKVKTTADRLPETLVVDVRDLRYDEPGKTTFTVAVSFDARAEYDQENWDNGMRLYSGSAVARLHLNLTLRCEATTKLVATGAVLPDAVFRLRVTEARLGYDHFEVDHIAGVGGKMARLIGEAAKDGVEYWRPSLERRLLEKADAAIVKAGDTREVRLGLGQLVKGE